ncbi:MAG: endopeptidase La [Chitinophagales bacterium]
MLDKIDMLSLLDNDVEFLPLISMDKETEDQDESYDNVLPLLALRDNVLFPDIVIPITVGRDQSIEAVNEAMSQQKFIGVIAQIDPEMDKVKVKDLHPQGTVAKIVKMLKMPDGTRTLILHGRDKFSINKEVSETPFLQAEITPIPETFSPDTELDALMASMKDLAIEIIHLSPNIPSEATVVLKNIDSPSFLVHFIASNLNVNTKNKQKLLEIEGLKVRAHQVLTYLNTELQILELKDQIRSKVRTDIDKQQRDYFLQQQLKTIHEELGDGSTEGDIQDFIKRAASKKWGESVAKAFQKELKKLRRLNPAAPDYAFSINYIETLLDLPWGEYTKDDLDLKRAAKILDKAHHGLQKVKRRILEYLAVLKLKGDMKSPILCFVGPPGVGKTSLGSSIAKALKRKYIRMSLGGLHDESEIRGHRRTYIGSMPGRVIQSLKKAQSSNPVFILDEIDKVGKDFRGDPSSALLEVLDPEQNSHFYDNYLEQEYDLSKILFIATANSLDTIQPALRDRMEIIPISGYSLEEKVEIAKKYLVPKQREAHGLTGKHVQCAAPVIAKVVDEYTRESGVRELDRKIAALMRWTAKSVAMEEDYNKRLKKSDLSKILGYKKYDKDIYQDDNPPGVGVGLAWTPVGGEILFIEASFSKAKVEGKLLLTGNLGNVMKESATTALSYAKANSELLDIDFQQIVQHNIHLHVPEGAIPKDGPSAGIAMLTTLVSGLSDRKVKPYLAMTGEITLRGKVLPVGGIKEKVLAAKRAGIKEIILCHVNKRDVLDINENYIKGMIFHYVKTAKEVLALALV